jgi:disulfide bond formation protein DsbB
MLVFRWIVLLLLVAGLLCFAMYVGTGQPKWRILGIRIVKWTVIAALGFFAVLLLERMAMVL